jgi:hypothetical protein
MHMLTKKRSPTVQPKSERYQNAYKSPQNMNKNLNYLFADEVSKKNIHFVYESVAEWVYNELFSCQKNKFYNFTNIMSNFHNTIFNMNGHYQAQFTLREISGDPIEDNANKFLLEALHSLVNKMAKKIENVTDEKCEVPEELSQKINSLFWSM